MKGTQCSIVLSTLAHQGKYVKNTILLDLSGPRKKWHEIGPGCFFLLIQTLSTFWAERILILRIFFSGIFWAPSLGPTWARLGLGPGLGPGLGQAWARAWAQAWAQAWARAWAQTPPPAAAPPDEFSDPNLTPLPTHPGIKYVARTLAAMNLIFVQQKIINHEHHFQNS